MNERLARAAPMSCATFLTAYPDGPPRVGTPLALVWKFEGQNSLNDVMQSRDFPTNVEKEVMGRELRIQDPSARKIASVKVSHPPALSWCRWRTEADLRRTFCCCSPYEKALLLSCDS